MNTKIFPQTLIRLWVDPRRIVLIAENPQTASEMMRQIPLGLTTPSTRNEDTSGTSMNSRIQDTSLTTVNAVNEFFRMTPGQEAAVGGTSDQYHGVSCSTAWM